MRVLNKSRLETVTRLDVRGVGSESAKVVAETQNGERYDLCFVSDKEEAQKILLEVSQQTLHTPTFDLREGVAQNFEDFVKRVFKNPSPPLFQRQSPV